MLKQVSVFVSNEVGSLKKVTEVVKDNGVNLRAFASFDSPDFSILRLIVDEPEKAVLALQENHFSTKITEVLGIELEDKLGELNRVLSVLTENEINVNYVYSFLIRDNNKPIIIMNVDKMDIAKDVLNKNNINTVNQEDV